MARVILRIVHSPPTPLVYVLNDQVVDVDAAHHVHSVIIQTLDQLAADHISHILCITLREPHKTGRNNSRDVVLIRPFQYMSSCFAYSDGCVATRFIYAESHPESTDLRLLHIGESRITKQTAFLRRVSLLHGKWEKADESQEMTPTQPIP